MIDSEARSSEKYADVFDFDILPLKPPYSPETYTAAIKFGGEQDYSVVIIDSLSHAWLDRAARSRWWMPRSRSIRATRTSPGET